jgi:hypothetical protein
MIGVFRAIFAAGNRSGSDESIELFGRPEGVHIDGATMAWRVCPTPVREMAERPGGPRTLEVATRTLALLLFPGFSLMSLSSFLAPFK